jgi:hypothetical protein
MTLIEIKPHRLGWKVFEAPGVEPVFLDKDQAINYAQIRASFRSGEIRVLEFDRQCRTHNCVQRSGSKDLTLSWSSIRDLPSILARDSRAHADSSLYREIVTA